MEKNENPSPPLLKICTEAPETQLRYVLHQASIYGNRVLWWLEIPYPLLRSWSCSGQYVEELNSTMPHVLLPLKSPNERIEENVRIKAAGVIREYKVAQRSSRRNANKSHEKIYKLAVLSLEVTCMSDLRTANANSGRVWKKKYENLEQEKRMDCSLADTSNVADKLMRTTAGSRILSEYICFY